MHSPGFWDKLPARIVRGMPMMKTSLRFVFNLERRFRKLGAIWFGCILALVERSPIVFAQSPKTSGDAKQDDLAAPRQKAVRSVQVL